MMTESAEAALFKLRMTDEGERTSQNINFMKLFTQKVLEVVKKIPKGRLLSYKEVAKLAGNPMAFRAVGNIMNKNRNPKVPCHRVIKSSGEVGGYAFGTKEKIKKLRKEGVKI